MHTHAPAIQTPIPECPASYRPALGMHRPLFAAAGVLCVALGALGVFVPGLPVTIFLIIASALFTKSCPWLEERLIRNRFFGPYLRYLDGKSRMPRRAKIITIAIMWTSVAASCWILLARTDQGFWAVPLVIIAAMGGTLMIALQGRGLPADPSAEVDRKNPVSQAA